MNLPRLTIKHIVFKGAEVRQAELKFQDGCNLIWGASNTGKSFVLEAIDFMLGGSTLLRDIEQLQGYETIWFGFTITGRGDFTVSRAVAGGAFSLYDGLVKEKPTAQSPRVLGQKHDMKNEDTLSSFLLDHLGFSNKFLAKDTFGEKKILAFRDLANILLVDETSIQAKRSPIENGQHSDRPFERSVFRLLLSGADDEAINPVENPKKTKDSQVTKLNLLDEMIESLDAHIAKEYPNLMELKDQEIRIDETLATIQTEFDSAQDSIRSLIEQKQYLSTQIPKYGGRLDEVQLHLNRFAQLEKVYKSDMERLEALEEASFLVSIGGNRNCPLCGAAPEAQMHRHTMNEIEEMREAANTEMSKIKLMRADLKKTVLDLGTEQNRLQLELPKLQEKLLLIETQINTTLPKTNEQHRKLVEVLEARDRIKSGLALLNEKNRLLSKRLEAGNVKPFSKKVKPNLDLSGTLAHEYCKVVQRVLAKWEFPGDRQVSFDDKNYDLKIDGKLRINNGKGVRAVTHAAFKVALLIFCHENGLIHPGFLILDTPLLTYRDPIRNPKHGALDADEVKLAKTTLKQNFFEHLSSIQDFGQFIILENVDPPENIQDLANVQKFVGLSGQSGEREGLFPSNIAT